MVGILVDLFSIYKCPTTNIAAANTTVNSAWPTGGPRSFRLPDFSPLLCYKRTSFPLICSGYAVARKGVTCMANGGQVESAPNLTTENSRAEMPIMPDAAIRAVRAHD